MIRWNQLVALASLAVLALPRVAAACPVCNAKGEEDSRVAFIVTTVFLSVLPVAMIGVGGWFLWRRIRAAEEAPRRVPIARRAPALSRRSPAA